MSHNLVLNQAANAAFQELYETIQSEMQRLHVPGVSFGILSHNYERIAGLGVTSIDNPLPVSATTLFQIGSITKTFLATLAMRLVEIGRLNLDAPILNYLPGLQMSDESVRHHVTMRHLLTHTGGWVGDYFNDFGPGDDALQRMVEQVGRLPQLTPLGEIWSYNNAGFYLAGRVIEVIVGMPFESALQQLVLHPLDLQRTFFFPQDIITERFAVGHILNEGQAVVARPWAVPRAAAPAGGLVTDIPTLLRYARFHMGNGTLTSGEQMLSRESLQRMQTPYFPATGISWMGLSWWIDEISGVRIIRHGGGTKGQISHLAIVPERQFALAILTNCEEADPLILAFRKKALEVFLGIPFPEAIPQNLLPELAGEYAGDYDSAMSSLHVSTTPNNLLLEITPKGGFPTPETPPGPPPPPVHLAMYAPDRFVGLDEPYREARGEFLRDSAGKIVWFRLGGRVHRRQ